MNTIFKQFDLFYFINYQHFTFIVYLPIELKTTTITFTFRNYMEGGGFEPHQSVIKTTVLAKVQLPPPNYLKNPCANRGF